MSEDIGVEGRLRELELMEKLKEQETKLKMLYQKQQESKESKEYHGPCRASYIETVKQVEVSIHVIENLFGSLEYEKQPLYNELKGFLRGVHFMQRHVDL